MVKLDIFSDPICPWCYIGKANLDRALERIGDHPFVIEWHPFQLNPDMPPEGMDRRAYLEGKFGGKAQAAKAYLPVAEAVEAAGLTLDLEAISRTPNTLDAHRLIHWAGIEGRQTLIVQKLFEAYFRDGRDIGAREVLCDLADGADMDAALIARLLASDADCDEIRARDTQARDMGLSSVPTFIVAGSHAVPGAQPVELWVQVMTEIMQQTNDEA